MISKNFLPLILLLAVLPMTPSMASKPPISIKKYALEVTVGPDGLADSVLHIELSATNDSAAREIAQQPQYFSESMEKMEITEAYTLKADGRKLSVDTNAIFPQSPPGAPQIPMFNDQKVLTLVFPDVTGNDVVVYTTHRKQLRPYIPGSFSFGFVFPKTIAIDDYSTIMHVPKSLKIYIENHNVENSKKTNKNDFEYHWTYSDPDAAFEDLAAVSQFDRLPRFYASTFRNFDEFSRAYSALIGDKVVATPRIQAKAAEITAGIADRRLQAKAIYEWVSRHIRYVAVFLNNGGLVPHDPDAILANGYGDCKDHTALFAALLGAKGIKSEPVLINTDNAYTLSDIGVLGPLNHLISWLPEFGMYADTTAGVAPFGMLPIAEYGKPVIHVLTSGKVVRSTPVLPPGAYDTTVKTVSRLGLDGKFSGETTTAATGVPSIFLRQAALQIQSAGSERVAKAVLKGAGLEGSGTFDVASPYDYSATYTLSGHFELDPEPAILSGERFAPPIGFRILDRPGVSLMGPMSVRDLSPSEPTPCFSGHQLEESSVDLPLGKRVARLPPDTDIKDDNFHFTARWSSSGQTISVQREFTSSIDQALCTGRLRERVAAAINKMRDDYRTIVWLNPN